MKQHVSHEYRQSSSLDAISGHTTDVPSQSPLPFPITATRKMPSSSPLDSRPTIALIFLTVLILCLATTFTVYRFYKILTRSPPGRTRTRRRVAPTPNNSDSRNSQAQSHPQPHPQAQGQSQDQAQSQVRARGHLLIVLGSGGHTAEMLGILRTLGRTYLDTRFARRTWVISSGDAFSAGRAAEIEREWEVERQRETLLPLPIQSPQSLLDNKELLESESISGNVKNVTWDIVTVRRARRVHQSLVSTPLSAVGCLWDCICVLTGRGSGEGEKPMSGQVRVRGQGEQERDRGDHGTETDSSLPYPYPDLILTNGPGTAVIMVLASLILLFLGMAPVTTKMGTTGSKMNTAQQRGNMRSVYVESWARVKTLSLSGKILRFLADRMLVQWEGLADVDGTEVIGAAAATTPTTVDERRDGSARRSDKSIRGGVSTSESVSWPRKLEYVGPVVT